MKRKQMLVGVWGLVVGDALGVPVEFESREDLREDPVVDMRGYGSYDQPAGAWSDDSSMALCTLESLTRGLDYEDIMRQFYRWADEDYMTPYDEVFDMGRATRESIIRFAHGAAALESGGKEEHENGNGSLMRILPVAFYLHATLGEEYSKKAEAYEIIHNASKLTHAHPISLISCGIYCAIACHLLNGDSIQNAIGQGIEDAVRYYRRHPLYMAFLHNFRRVELQELMDANEDSISSSGYVLHSLEASLWCLLHTSGMKECLLKAVNLGRDTDTTGAIVGGLAGIYYGRDAIPTDWRATIAKGDMIDALCAGFADAYIGKGD